MFNIDIKEAAIERLLEADRIYKKIAEEVKVRAGSLHILRFSSKQVIQEAEEYANRLAKSPIEFTKVIGDIFISFKRFESNIQEILVNDNATEVSGTLGGAGVLAGAGIAAFGPSAAVALASTFGTASTGTAISVLSGAAATNAILAWLGGGALAAGGGGIAAGEALLGLAGPIGWTIGGVALVGAAVWARMKNQEIAEKANDEAVRVRKQTRMLEATNYEISKLFDLTKMHVDRTKANLYFLQNEAPQDYTLFTEDQKLELGSLINNIQSLSELLNKRVGE